MKLQESVKVPFYPADILLPKTQHEAWAVIACDQHTSEPEYWEEVERTVGSRPSSLRITLPEIFLPETDDAGIVKIHRTMEEYLSQGILMNLPDAMILVERTLSDGRIRYGIVGAIPLSAYDYTAGEKPMIRATEGTVLSRIPPRVRIRKDAPLELPHVMLLCDDPMGTVILPLVAERNCFSVVYDFDLMMNGGHLKGYLLPSEAQNRVRSALSRLMPQDGDPMLFAVGDGNHSLAAAKACAALSSVPQAERTLVELVNIHDPALDFEPIYRVLFGVDGGDVVRCAEEYFRGQTGKTVTLLHNGTETAVSCADTLVCRAVQEFIDGYLKKHPAASVDYIHGEDSLKTLSSGENTCGFRFGGITKAELFSYVRENGSLPRKTFSMGEAQDKRYYMEARRIR